MQTINVSTFELVCYTDVELYEDEELDTIREEFLKRYKAACKKSREDDLHLEEAELLKVEAIRLFMVIQKLEHEQACRPNRWN